MGAMSSWCQIGPEVGTGWKTAEIRKRERIIDSGRLSPTPWMRPAPLRSISVAGTDQLSLAEFDRELPLGLRHLTPQFLQVRLHRLIVWLLVQCPGEPSIGGWEIPRRAQAGGIKRPHLNHRFRISRIRSRPQQVQAAIAILWCSLAVQIFSRFADRIARDRGPWFRRGVRFGFSGCGRSIRSIGRAISSSGISRSLVRRTVLGRSG